LLKPAYMNSPVYAFISTHMLKPEYLLENILSPVQRFIETCVFWMSLWLLSRYKVYLNAARMCNGHSAAAVKAVYDNVLRCVKQSNYLVWLLCKKKRGLNVFRHTLPGLALGNAQLEGDVLHARLHIFHILVESGNGSPQRCFYRPASQVAASIQKRRRESAAVGPEQD